MAIGRNLYGSAQRRQWAQSRAPRSRKWQVLQDRCAAEKARELQILDAGRERSTDSTRKAKGAGWAIGKRLKEGSGQVGCGDRGVGGWDLKLGGGEFMECC